jgi:hypothetical protein
VPRYGFGNGPAYLSGQTEWFSGPAGQVAFLLVDKAYSGPVTIRARRLDGSATIVLANTAASSPQLRSLAGGAEGMELPAAGASGWRVWQGNLTASAPGCFGIQFDGNGFTSVVVLSVETQTASPAG